MVRNGLHVLTLIQVMLLLSAPSDTESLPQKKPKLPLVVEVRTPKHQNVQDFLCPSLNEQTIFEDLTKPGISHRDVVRLLVGCQNKYNFTYPQLKLWKTYYENNFFKFSIARRVPLCVLRADVEAATTFVTPAYLKLKRFVPILRKLEELEVSYKTDKTMGKKLYIWSLPSAPVFDLLQIDVRKIETSDVTYGKALNQWISVRIKFSTPIDGIIVQPVEGFLGLPFGEFRTDFECPCAPPCSDEEDLNAQNYPDMGTIPCKYKPKHSLRHPQIFVVGGSEGTTGKHKTFAFHFNWINVLCHEVAAFQFIIIAIKDASSPPVEGPSLTDTFMPFLTPVYEIKVSATADGLPTHYYPNPLLKPICQKVGASQKSCHRQNDICTPQSCVIGLISPCPESYIPYSRVYDNCILGNPSPSDGESCPPGPFLCTENSSYKDQDLDDWKEWRSKKVFYLQECFKHTPRTETNCKGIPEDEDLFHHVHTPLDATAAPFQENRRVLQQPPVVPKIQSRRKRALNANVELTKPMQHEDFKGRQASPTTTATITTTSTTTTTTPAPQNNADFLDMEIASEILGVQHYKLNKRLHGLLMIFAFLVINPISSHIARYFKETAANSCFGMPTWLLFHILLSVISLFIMWFGIVASLANMLNGSGVVPCADISDNSDLEVLHNLCEEHQGSGWHFFAGALAVVSFHTSAIVGWTRPKESRGVYITTHSFSGYFGQISALTAIWLVNASVCREIHIESAVLFFLASLMFLSGCGVQLMQDARLQVKRHWFPVAEGQKIRDEIPPCHWIKVFFFMLGILIQFLFGLIIMVSYQVINKNDLFSPETNKSSIDKTDSSIAYAIDVIWVRGCKLINDTTLLYASRIAFAIKDAAEKNQNGP